MFTKTAEPKISTEDHLRPQVAELEAAQRQWQATEAALRQNEQNLWNFFNTIDHLLFVLDANGNILNANETVYRRLGYTPAELIGQSVLMVHPAHRREEAGRIVADMLAGRCDYCPVPVQTKDGQLIPVETRVRSGEWSGQPVIFGITKDLSGLKASEEKFAKIFEVSPTPMAITDLATNEYIDVNVAFLSTLGFTRADVIGHTAAELNLFANLDQRTHALQTLQEQGCLRDFDVTVRTKSGEIRQGLFAAEIIQLQDRRVLLTVMNDITERKQMEHRLRTSEAQYRQMFTEHAAVRLLIEPITGAIVDANAAASAFYGYPVERLRQMSIQQINTHAPEQIWRDLAAVQNQLRSHFVFQHRLASGEVRDVEVYSTPIQIGNQQLLYSVIHDITERQQMERALRASEEKFRRVVEESRDALSLCDEEGCIIEWNHSTEMLTGISRAEALGQPYWEIQWRLMPPERRSPGVFQHLQQQFQLALQTGHAPFMDKPIVARFLRADGEPCIALQHIYLIKTARGYWLGNTSHDITDLKRTEAALNELNAELEHRVAERTRELIEANLRLTELDRLKDEFISRINHELRTPLTSIKAYIELMNFGKPEKLPKYLHIIGEQSERLQQIIENLLEVPQLRVGDIDVNPELVEINALVDGLCANRQSAAALRGVQLYTRLTTPAPLIMTDKALVLRALLNVVTNALNYTPKGGAVTLSTASHTETDRLWVTISVSDTGPGISEKDRPYIFEPFYRGDASNDYKTPGTGVGLFMARRLLDTLGGKISIESTPGEGATFTLWLPNGEANLQLPH